ncbi:MAG: ribonuclease HII [Nitrososphaerota archaeon]
MIRKNLRLIAGIDEAGRGSLVGPLVVAAVALPPNSVRTLRTLGVRDSKQLSRNNREKIYREIINLCPFVESIEIPPSVIDRYTKRSGGPGINALEAAAAASLIEKIRPDIVYIDSPTRIAREFAKMINSRLEEDRCVIVCEHGADVSRPVVSAASIIAKVVRDNAIKSLKNRLGDFGSGYPSDKKTISAIKEILTCGKEMTKYIRMSWKTLNSIQPSLDDYKED